MGAVLMLLCNTTKRRRVGRVRASAALVRRRDNRRNTAAFDAARLYGPSGACCFFASKLGLKNFGEIV